MATAEHWPKCPDCKRSFLSHQVRGLIAYCDQLTGKRAPWPKNQVLEWRLDVGMKVSAAMVDAATRAEQGH